MRRTLPAGWLVLALGGTGGAIVAQDVANLLPNSSFEAAAGDEGDLATTPADWHRRTWSGAPRFALDLAVARTGEGSVRIDSTEGADASWSTEVEVQPHTRYRLSGWVRSRGLLAGSGRGAQLGVHQLQLRAATRAVHGDQDWTELAIEFDSGAHDRLLFNLLFGGWGRSTGTVWFDDVALIDLTPPLPELTDAAAHAWYRERVHPILQTHCYKCHGPESELRGHLFLGNRESVLRGGESGPAISLEEPRNSLLLRAVQYEVFEMPPKRKLAAEHIETLRTWVRLGAPFDPALASATPAALSAEKPPLITEAARAHWAFQPVDQPGPPADGSDDAPIDRFVRARLAEQGLDLAPRADRATLIRRLYHDVLGLPPTPAAVRAFVADPSPDAWPALVDSVLASPHYGERWGRHWLDVVRYAETNSFERDGRKPFAWRYRDWVIDAFNADMPYDRFLLEQLAGDELAPQDPGARIATGYYRLGQWDDEPADPEQARFDELDDILTTTAQGMLGLTLNCARCHDHKLDPFPQTDYYRMLAFFRGVRRYGVRSPASVEERSVRVIASAEEQREHADQIERHQAALAALQTRIEALADRARPRFSPVDHEEFAHERNQLAILSKHVGESFDRAALTEFEALLGERDALRRAPPPALAQALCVTERAAPLPATHVLIRGNPHVQGPPVEPGVPEVLGVADPAIEPPPQGESSGRRLALARWIASADNPLTPRVIVNRIWQHHFGRGIVAQANDFGTQSTPPTHRRLLDWLAAELVARGWRLKALHRLILLSRTWCQDFRRHPQAERVDPDNTLLWRFEPRRMTAEEVRDSMLAVSGQLDRAMHGPSVHPEIPAAVLAGQSRPGDGWPTTPAPAANRRSIYVHAKRSLRLPLIEAFDAADTDFTCPVRFQTIQPTQALTLLNGDFAVRQAASFAGDLYRVLPDDPDGRVALALWRTTQRPPRSDEVTRGAAFVESLRQSEGYDAEDALARFCLLTYNLNEFVYLR